MTDRVFFQLQCLTEQSKNLSGIALLKKWFKKSDRRAIGQSLQKFVSYNSELFGFLGIRPHIVGTDHETVIRFQSSEFIGVIPLRAPDTGKQIGDFIVTPRYSGTNLFDDYVEIITLLEEEITPELFDSIPLASRDFFQPPIYLEAIKYIQALELLVKKSWKKFEVITRKTPNPSGNVNWDKYVRKSYKVENCLKYEISQNTLSENHKEFSNLKYVYEFCRKELTSSTTPIRIRNSNKRLIKYLDEKLYSIPVKSISKFQIRNSDSPVVKKCKLQANRIIINDFSGSVAWRINFSQVFEKYIQFLFKEVAKDCGGRVLNNFRINRKSYKYKWDLKYIEPDAIYVNDNLIIYIDAKYKSNLYNRNSSSNELKDEHRHDLHQIMAYSGFTNGPLKNGILCYPSERIESQDLIYENRINETKCVIKILGIPLKKAMINESVKYIAQEINAIKEKDHITIA